MGTTSSSARTAMRWTGCAAPIVIALVLAGCGASEQPTTLNESEQLRAVSSVLDLPAERLRQAVADARVSDRASMISLRAAAGRAGDALRAAQQDLQLMPGRRRPGIRARPRQMAEGLAEIFGHWPTRCRPARSPSTTSSSPQSASTRRRQALTWHFPASTPIACSPLCAARAAPKRRPRRATASACPSGQTPPPARHPVPPSMTPTSGRRSRPSCPPAQAGRRPHSHSQPPASCFEPASAGPAGCS